MDLILPVMKLLWWGGELFRAGFPLAEEIKRATPGGDLVLSRKDRNNVRLWQRYKGHLESRRGGPLLETTLE